MLQNDINGVLEMCIRDSRIIIVMPDTMSVERRQLMKAYGAELVLSEVPRA